MAKQDYTKGQYLHRRGELVQQVDILLTGKVKVSDSIFSITEENGALLGLLEVPGEEYRYDYLAIEEVSTLPYEVGAFEEIPEVLRSVKKILTILGNGAENTVIKSFVAGEKLLGQLQDFASNLPDIWQKYHELCKKCQYPEDNYQMIRQYEVDMSRCDTRSWKYEYFQGLHELPQSLKKALEAQDGIIIGNIMDAAEYLQYLGGQLQVLYQQVEEILPYVIGLDGQNLLESFSELLLSVIQDEAMGEGTPQLVDEVRKGMKEFVGILSECSFLDQNLLQIRTESYRKVIRELAENSLGATTDEAVAQRKAANISEELNGSLNKIMNYGGLEDHEKEIFTEVFRSYKELPDRHDSSDEARRVRRALTDQFYFLYENVFLVYAEDPAPPVVISMFLQYGYLDQDMAGEENAVMLFRFVEEQKPDPEERVVTMPEWLMRIYRGEEMPSRNEFDTDYVAYQHERKVKGEITAEQENALLQDSEEKVRFEIQNLLKTASRITSGTLSTFCPVFAKENVGRDLENILMNTERLQEAIDGVRAVDYGCFFREVSYSNPEVGINQEFIQKEVLPYMILMPNVGSRASLWQEIAGAKRDTRARMLVPIFCLSNLKDLVLHLCGEFRWEMCKRIQGVFWNDISDPSLTAEYADYIDFYKKNRDLSPDAKEKVKEAIAKCRKSVREVFTLDYEAWVRYEANGSPRLNKVARGILFTYCTFPAKLREEYRKNPMYTDMVDRYGIKQNQKIHTLELLMNKIEKNGAVVPEELQEQMAFLKR